MSDSIELAKAYDPAAVEARWYATWEERGYFRADARAPGDPFCIVLPPPNVTGSLHMGHALTATLEDILIRHRRMSGRAALWLPGTDHAGIATQMVVERELKREGTTRHDLGRAEFTARVWRWKEQKGDRIALQHRRLGASLDWSRERFTMDAPSSRAVREAFVRLHEDGQIFRARRLINWCTVDRTALSNAEVEYEQHQGKLWYLRYRVEGEGDRTVVVATTRPETMLGDTAVAVHPDDPRHADLVGRTVALPLAERLIPIVADPALVSLEFGTGAVKVTPGHDFADFEVGKRHGLPVVSIFDGEGRTTDAVPPRYRGLTVQEARKRVLADLDARGLLVKEEPYEHPLPRCYRCGSVIEPMVSEQWFVKTDTMGRDAVEAVRSGVVRIVPAEWTQSYFQWQEEYRDWCISRQLWWGHRIPVFYCDAPGGCGNVAVSRDDLSTCPRCGKPVRQDEDVLDTWFSSALWPLTTLGWPDATPDLAKWYPTSVLETGHDILTFWVSRMLLFCTYFAPAGRDAPLAARVPFRTVYLHAMVRDEKGEKMSKSKGNVIDPLDVVDGATLEALVAAVREQAAPDAQESAIAYRKERFPEGLPRCGADALRFTLAQLAAQGRDIKLQIDRLLGNRAFCNKIWQAVRFARLNLAGFDAAAHRYDAAVASLPDRWILAGVDRTAARVHAALEALEFAEAANELYAFVWHELCDWYIEMAKPVLGAGADPAARAQAQGALVLALDASLRMLHPFAPFVTEELCQALPRATPLESIMRAEFPRPPEHLPAARYAAGALVDPGADMEWFIEMTKAVRTVRGEFNVAPSKRPELTLSGAAAGVERLRALPQNLLTFMTGTAAVHYAGEPPKGTISQDFGLGADRVHASVHLAGTIDVDAELARIDKDVKKTEKELEGVTKKLANEQFVSRAPAEILEKERGKQQELQATLEARAQARARIAALKP